MSQRIRHVPTSSKNLFRATGLLLCMAGLVSIGCSDSGSLPKDTVSGTPVGAGVGPAEEIKPNVKKSTPPPKVEPQ